MASKELIIDDDYCREMGRYFSSQGDYMDRVINQYISILQGIKNNAIISGDVANALKEYISYANKLQKQIGYISDSAKIQVDAFLLKVDEADQYLF